MAIYMDNYEGIYHNPTLWLITICYALWDVLTITDKNLGQTEIYDFDTSIRTDATMWYRFQWGNNYWWNYSETLVGVEQQVDTTWYWPGNYYSSNIYRGRGSGSYYDPFYDWSDPVNPDLWWNVTDTLAARRWPCPEWFHIPESWEINLLLKIIGNRWKNNSWSENTTMIKALKLQQSVYFWSSTTTYYTATGPIYIQDVNSFSLYTYTSGSYHEPIYNASIKHISLAYIRPFKNEPVLPIWNDWTVLFEF